MRIEIDHGSAFDWAVRHESQLEPSMVARPAPDLGPGMHLVRVAIDSPTTILSVPDEDIGIMHRDHKQGVADAAQGGWPHPVTGEPVPPRTLPSKSPKQLLAEHVEAVLAHHVNGAITAVRVPGYPAVEAYLSARLVTAGDDAANAELLPAGDESAAAELSPADDELQAAAEAAAPGESA